VPKPHLVRYFVASSSAMFGRRLPHKGMQWYRTTHIVFVDLGEQVPRESQQPRAGFARCLFGLLHVRVKYSGAVPMDADGRLFCIDAICDFMVPFSGLFCFCVRYSQAMKNLSNRYMHLTNYSVNKCNSAYQSNTDDAVRQGHKWYGICLYQQQLITLMNLLNTC
jgi:hypothetical protein